MGYFLILTVGEECVFDKDCESDGGYCVGNICVLEKKEDQNVFSLTGEFTRTASLTLTCLTYRIRRDFLAFGSLLFLKRNLELVKQSPKSPTFM